MEGKMFQREHFRHWGPERIFQKGDFKFLILDLLKEKPRHGYEIIRELEGKFQGFYSPSPGTVYPTLQYLEDMGHVTSKEQDGKRTYTITEEGIKFLSERAETLGDIKEQMRGHWRHWSSEFGEQFRDVMREYGEIGRVLGQKARRLSADKLPRIGSVLKNAISEIEKIVSEEPPAKS
jgi:DNA-binding PadR family transcriptional regulator